MTEAIQGTAKLTPEMLEYIFDESRRAKDREEGIARGFEQGFEKGFEKGRWEIINGVLVRSFAKGLADDLIASICELDLDLVKKARRRYDEMMEKYGQDPMADSQEEWSLLPL